MTEISYLSKDVQEAIKIYDYDLEILCKYEWAIEYIKNNMHMLQYNHLWELCEHYWAESIIKQNIHKLNSSHWMILCNKKWAKKLIEDNIHKLDDDCINELYKHLWGLDIIINVIQSSF